MKFENTEVWGFQHAIRGMRNLHESWEMSESSFGVKVRGTGEPVGHKRIIRNFGNGFIEYVIIGENDLRLMQSLIKAGSEHRKFMRQIFVSVDITAPLCWWEGVRLQIGTVSDSCSIMRELESTPITRECFEMDDYENVEVGVQDFTISEYWFDYIECLESLRQKYNKLMEDKKYLEEIKSFEEAKKAQVMAKKYWKELIRLLPESWLQKRTITMSYENVLTMVRQRENHKLTEWSEKFIEWAHTLPYADELLFLEAKR
jgi:hypothetical protein